VEGLPYFIMEFVDGLNLRQLEKAGKLPPREALQIVPQICEALQFAHDAGIVHRDIKPENILVDKQGRVKIADFGIAKILGRESHSPTLTQGRQVIGTPHYMAPEQVEKPQTVDHRADIYSLGVVFYEMLTGELPLGKFAPPSKTVQVDVRLDEVVLHALEKQPERRYQQASEVKTAVENIAGTSGPHSEPSPRLCPAAVAGAWMAWFVPFSFLLTTALGWIAVTQIRRSAGRLYGMGLAVFDGLLFPLLALDSLIVLGVLSLTKLVAEQRLNLPGSLFPDVASAVTWTAAMLAILVGLDFFIIGRVWRVVNRPRRHQQGSGVMSGVAGSSLALIPAILIGAVLAFAALVTMTGRFSRAKSPPAASTRETAAESTDQVSGIARTTQAVVQEQVATKLAAMKSRLRLTDDQERAVRVPLEKKLGLAGELSTRMTSGVLSRDDMDTAERALRQFEEQIQGAMTPDQRAEYEGWQVEQRHTQAQLVANVEVMELQPVLQLTQDQRAQVLQLLTHLHEQQLAQTYDGLKVPSDWEQQLAAIGDTLRPILRAEQLPGLGKWLDLQRETIRQALSK
jgi:hypothetical protein